MQHITRRLYTLDLLILLCASRTNIIGHESIRYIPKIIRKNNNECIVNIKLLEKRALEKLEINIIDMNRFFLNLLFILQIYLKFI